MAIVPMAPHSKSKFTWKSTLPLPFSTLRAVSLVTARRGRRRVHVMHTVMQEEAGIVDIACEIAGAVM